MKMTELRGQSADQLEQLLGSKRQELLELETKLQGGEHKQVRQLRALKKDIARVLSVRREVQLSASEGSPAKTLVDQSDKATSKSKESLGG